MKHMRWQFGTFAHTMAIQNSNDNKLEQTVENTAASCEYLAMLLTLMTMISVNQIHDRVIQTLPLQF